MTLWFIRNVLVFVGVALPVICLLETLLLRIAQGTSSGGVFSGNPIAAPFELLPWAFLAWLTTLAPAAASVIIHAVLLLGFGFFFGGAPPKWLAMVSTLVVPLVFYAFVRLALTARPKRRRRRPESWAPRQVSWSCWRIWRPTDGSREARPRSSSAPGRSGQVPEFL